MTNPVRPSTSILRSNLRRRGFALTLVCALTMVAVQSAQTQTFTVLHSFTSGADGATPYSGLTIDRAGNLYGTASEGGNTSCRAGCGTVFKLFREGAGWVLNPLYNFHGSDGAYPFAGLIFGSDGSLYGTTGNGGNPNCYEGCGTVFNLTPGPTACHTALCGWKETVLYEFAGPPGDGAGPGNLVFDSAGNLYGTSGGGSLDFCDDQWCGIVFELSPTSGGWTETILHDFGDGDGFFPNKSVVLDSAGNLYGTAWGGGTEGGGTVFEVTPEGYDSPTQAIYNFYYPGMPSGGVIFDQAGNLCGTTSGGGTDNGGMAFELLRSGSSWVFSVLYNFVYSGSPADSGPHASLTTDAEGNLYGTTYADGANGCGSVFKLTLSNGSWNYSSLHDFNCGIDGAYPYSNVVIDGAGNLYGTASAGGTSSQCTGGCGTAWEITP